MSFDYDQATAHDRAVVVATLRKEADDIDAEMVCCDVYDGNGAPRNGHAICYWGGAVAHRLREKADTLAARA